MTLHHRIASVFLVLGTLPPASAQNPIVYNAARGSLPSAQCFTHAGGTTSIQIINGELHAGPTSAAGSSFFQRSDFAVDLAAGFAMEATFRVVFSDCGMNAQNAPRYGIQLSIVDDSLRFCAAHFCSTGVLLVNTPNDPIGSMNVVAAPYSVAGQTITARVETDASHYRLLVNGALLLTVPHGTYTGSGRSFYFGDGTGAAGSEYYLSALRATGTSPNCTPTSIVNVSSGCTGLGTLGFSGILQPAQSANLVFTMPGPTLGGFPVVIIGPYAMQIPYCAAGCRLGLDPTSPIVSVGESLAVSLPAMSALVGWPLAFQGARLGLPGACSTPAVHALTDISVLTL